MHRDQPRPPRVKVCGLRSLDEALAAVDAGVDALGFNFHPDSVRHTDLRTAARVIAALPPFVATVAVWVNPQVAQVREALGACRWSALQFSGDEAEELLSAFPADLVLRTARLDCARALKSARALPRCAAVLVDAAPKIKGSYGGTGRLARWDLAEPLARERAVILAGGLNPSNVAEAVRCVFPYAVDAASGLESSPG
ncbi:MAG: phosphoribosylanthranilate isomerase, partial [bacterium]